MSKSIAAPLAAHIAQETTTLCRCWRITRIDGVEFFFTDAAADVVFEGATYSAASGFESAAVGNEAGLASSAVTITGFFDSGAITIEDMRAGRFDGAEVRLCLVNWANPDQGSIKVRRGWLGEVVSNPQGAFSVELRSLSQALQQNMGEVYSPECRAQLGDGRCKVNLAAWTVTAPIATVASRGVFSVTLADPKTDGYFNGGLATFQTGENAGRSMEIRGYIAASRTVSLFLPVGYLPVPGDSVTLVAGCDKRVQTCRDRFHNVVNFRGEPALPGNDKVLLYPGQANSTSSGGGKGGAA